MAKKIEIKSGTKYGKLTFTGEYVNVNRRWLCKYECECGNKCYVCRHDFVESRLNPTCGCESPVNGWQERHNNYGDQYPFVIILSRCQKSAKARKIDVLITIDDIKNIWNAQGGKCFYTGIKLQLANGFKSFDGNDLSPSIDRIDSNLPYTKDNIRIVHKEINRMKLCLSHEKFVEYCKIISKRFKNEYK